MKKILEEQRIAKRVTLVGAFWDALLGLAKIAAGYFSQSQALIADGIHSLSDLVTDVFVYIAADSARQGPDENHPYGHLRYETLTTIILGLVLMIVAAGIAFETFSATNTPQVTWFGLTAIILTIVIKEAIFHYTRNAGEKIASKMLIANAWHSRSDALSSVAVLFGLLGIYLGYAWADTVASLVVALLIAKIAFEMIWENVAELVDTAPDKNVLDRIQTTVGKMHHISRPHDIRARSMAGKVYLDMHINVPSHISVSEGHYLSDKAIYTIKRQHPNVADVLIHIDPDGVDIGPDGQDIARLPSREQVLADLEYTLRLYRTMILFNQTKLHYFSSGLEIELIAEATLLPDNQTPDKINEQLTALLQSLPYCQKSTVLWRF